MAIIFADGMDSYTATADLTAKFDNNSDVIDNTFNSTAGRFGGGAIVCADDGQWLDKIIPPTGSAVTTDELFVSIAASFSDLTFSTSQGFLGFSQNGDIGAATASTLDGLWITANAGVLQLYRGSSLIATGSFALSTGVWYRIECRVVINASSGIFQIRVNETLDIDFSGDTDDVGPLSINVVKLGSINAIGAVTYDDIVIHNSAGAAPTGFLGDLRIETLRPDGAGDSSGSTVTGAATRHEAVDDPGMHDGDTTYVSMGAAAEDLYTLSNLSFSPATVHAVVTNIVSRADGTTPRIMRGKVKQGTTEGNGTSRTVNFGASYTITQDSFPTNPDTAAAWTETEINSMQAGQEVTT